MDRKLALAALVAIPALAGLFHLLEGAGLAGVRDRVLESGGTLEITSPSGGGTTVRARLPVDRSSAR